MPSAPASSVKSASMPPSMRLSSSTMYDVASVTANRLSTPALDIRNASLKVKVLDTIPVLLPETVSICVRLSLKRLFSYLEEEPSSLTAVSENSRTLPLTVRPDPVAFISVPQPLNTLRVMTASAVSAAMAVLYPDISVLDITKLSPQSDMTIPVEPGRPAPIRANPFMAVGFLIPSALMVRSEKTVFSAPSALVPSSVKSP